MPSGEPIWHSMLFVRTVNQRFVAGAAGGGADAIILDLVATIRARTARRV